MKITGIWAIAAAIAATAAMHGSCVAGEKAATGGPGIIAELAGNVVPTSVLKNQHGRGGTNINVVNNTRNNTISGGDGSAFDSGIVRGNAVIGTSTTGTISTSNSVNNNMGFTTVFENSGNNSQFQQSTSINITIH